GTAGRPIPQELVAGAGSELVDSKYRVPETLLALREHADYVDPVGKLNDPLFKPYNHRWLAAAAPVWPPVGAVEKSESGLVVLVQSDYQSVVRPARLLGEQFMRNS